MSRLAVALLLLGLASPAWAARQVWVCSAADGSVTVTAFANDDAAAGLSKLQARGAFADATGCRWTDPASLPSRDRPDPRAPEQTITQRHRWRQVPDGTVVVDPTVNRPQILPILREVRRTIGPDRMAALLATPIGDNLLRAVRTEDWALARSLLRQALADRVLTPAEASAIRDVAQEYEADLE